MGGEVVGINTDTLDDNQDGIKEAKEILKAKGASYKNLTSIPIQPSENMQETLWHSRQQFL